MQVILDENLDREIWDKLFTDYSFSPSVDGNSGDWIKPKSKFRKYKLRSTWDEQQERIVNNIFCNLARDEMYALDWQHDCFIFDPKEKIPMGYHFHDTERECNVYFPEYYPNGDYHFFVTKDFSIGLYGHPWKQEIIVVGELLIREMEKKLVELDLMEI